MIRIRAAYLVGVDIWQIEGAKTRFAMTLDDAERNGTPHSIKPTDIDATWTRGLTHASLVSYSWDGLPLSKSTIYESKRPIPACWAERCVRACIRSRINADYLTWEAIVEITPKTVSQLIGAGRTECTTQMVDLLRAVFPPCTGEHVVFREHYPPYAFVLYIEPETAFSKEYDSVREYAAAVLALLGQSKFVPQPHLFGDVILTHGIGAGVPERTLFAAGLGLLPIDRVAHRGISLPMSVLDIAAYFRYAGQLQHVADRLRNLPFYKQQVMEYIARLKKESTLERGYGAVFLSDREYQVYQQVRAAEIMDEIRRLLEHNSVSIHNTSPHSETNSIDLSNPLTTPRTFDVFEAFADIVPKAERDLREAMRVVSGRVAALSDFLRDRVMVDTNTANRSLQRRIWWLTVVVTIATVVGAVIAIAGFVLKWQSCRS